MPTNLVHTGNSLRKLLTARASIDAAHIATNMSPDRITITVTPNLSFTWPRIYSEMLRAEQNRDFFRGRLPRFQLILCCFPVVFGGIWEYCSFVRGWLSDHRRDSSLCRFVCVSTRTNSCHEILLDTVRSMPLLYCTEECAVLFFMLYTIERAEESCLRCCCVRLSCFIMCTYYVDVLIMNWNIGASHSVFQ